MTVRSLEAFRRNRSGPLGCSRATCDARADMAPPALSNGTQLRGPAGRGASGGSGSQHGVLHCRRNHGGRYTEATGPKISTPSTEPMRGMVKTGAHERMRLLSCLEICEMRATIQNVDPGTPPMLKGDTEPAARAVFMAGSIDGVLLECRGRLLRFSWRPFAVSLGARRLFIWHPPPPPPQAGE